MKANVPRETKAGLVCGAVRVRDPAGSPGLILLFRRPRLCKAKIIALHYCVYYINS